MHRGLNRLWNTNMPKAEVCKVDAEPSAEQEEAPLPTLAQLNALSKVVQEEVNELAKVAITL